MKIINVKAENNGAEIDTYINLEAISHYYTNDTGKIVIHLIGTDEPLLTSQSVDELHRNMVTARVLPVN